MVEGICLATVDEADAEYFNVTPADGYTVKTGGSVSYEAPFYYEGSYSSMAVTLPHISDSDGDKIRARYPVHRHVHANGRRLSP